jgi:hypothetical protein
MIVNLSKIVSVIKEFMVIKPAGIILILSNKIPGQQHHESQRKLQLVPIPVQQKGTDSHEMRSGRGIA